MYDYPTKGNYIGFLALLDFTGSEACKIDGRCLGICREVLIVVSRIGLKDVRGIMWKMVSTDDAGVPDLLIIRISREYKVNVIAHLFCAGYLLPSHLLVIPLGDSLRSRPRSYDISTSYYENISVSA